MFLYLSDLRAVITSRQIWMSVGFIVVLSTMNDGCWMLDVGCWSIFESVLS